MREQIKIHLGKFLREIISDESVDHIVIMDGHRDITLKLDEEGKSQYHVFFKAEKIEYDKEKDRS